MRPAAVATRTRTRDQTRPDGSDRTGCGLGSVESAQAAEAVAGGVG